MIQGGAGDRGAGAAACGQVLCGVCSTHPSRRERGKDGAPREVVWIGKTKTLGRLPASHKIGFM